MSHISDETRTPARGEPAQIPDAEVVEAVAAAYALMAHADGEAAGVERRKFLAFLRGQPRLSGPAQRELAEAMAIHEANFRLDPEVAQQIARETLATLASTAMAGLVVEACRRIIPADGVFHPAEWRQLSSIKALLGQVEGAKPVQSWHSPSTASR